MSSSSPNTTLQGTLCPKRWIIQRDQIMATKSEILKEALLIASEALRELELSEASLTSIALKASRIARITGDFDMQQIMLFEAGGYPSEPTGVQPEIWSLAVKAKRIVKEKRKKK